MLENHAVNRALQLFEFNNEAPHWNVISLGDEYIKAKEDGGIYLRPMQIVNFCFPTSIFSFKKNKENAALTDITSRVAICSIVQGNVDNASVVEYLQPNENETVVRISDNWKPAHIARAFGMFESVSDANKNGFKGKDIPKGFSELRGIKVSGAKVSIFCLKG